MRTRTTPALATRLSGVRREFETWRGTRAGRSPIPARLWGLAVAHAREVGVHATARQLRLNYYSLKQRVEAAGGAGGPGAGAAPAFVEVMPMAVEPTRIAECVIDFADARGATMRIALKSPALPDLAALSQVFWRARG